jgi:hypothetical protein
VTVLDIGNFSEANLSEDGRRLYLMTMEYKSSGSSIWDRHNGRSSARLIPQLAQYSTKTGDKVADVWTMADEGKTHRHLSHDVRAGRLYTTEYSGDDFTVQALPLGKDKPLWEKKLEGKASQQVDCDVMHAGGDGPIACSYGEFLERPEPQQGPPGRGQRPQMQQATRTNLVVLNSKTGETMHRLSQDDTLYATMHGFSHDGQLFLGELSSGSSSTLNVWHTGTGKVLKTWGGNFSSYRSDDREQRTAFAFAPKSHELATLHAIGYHIEGPKTFTPPTGHGQTNWTQTPNILRTEYTTTIGLWDFASLLK